MISNICKKELLCTRLFCIFQAKIYHHSASVSTLRGSHLMVAIVCIFVTLNLGRVLLGLTKTDKDIFCLILNGSKAYTDF